MSRAQEDDVSVTARNQLNAAENECAHEDVAQFAVGLHEHQQLFALNLNHLAGLACTYSHQSPAAGQHAGFTSELARTKRSDDMFARVGPDNFELTTLDDEEPRVCRSGFDQDFTMLNGAVL